MLLPTTVVGSHPQPEWLVNHEALGRRSPPRVRARDVWRVEPAFLTEAQDDAVRLAVDDMERAGIDIITDGEARRESYSNQFANALDGIDRERFGEALNRAGRPDQVPLVTGRVQRREPVNVDDARFLRHLTSRAIKVTLPGPFTMSQQAQDAYYGDLRLLALDYADAVAAEIADLTEAGVDVIQLDEPYLQSFEDDARRYAVEAIDRALHGARVPTVVHTCFGYAHFVKAKTIGYPFLTELADCRADFLAIEAAQPSLDLSVLSGLVDKGKSVVLGVVALDTDEDTAISVADRIRDALRYVPADKLVVSPDCGMKYLGRERANAKLRILVEAAAAVRAGLVRER